MARVLRFLAVIWIVFFEAGSLLATESPLQILVTLPALYSWAVQVGGDRVRVGQLLPDNADPHHFQFRPRDLEALQHADLILLNGAGLEDWVKSTVEKQSSTARDRIVEVFQGLPIQAYLWDQRSRTDSTQAVGSTNGSPNPHLWLDPILACHGVSNILRVLIKLDPASTPTFSKNASNYFVRLRQLDTDYASMAHSLRSPTIVTVHSAFPYLCRRYGISVLGVIEESPGIEPGPRYLAQLSEQIRSHNIRTLFVQPHSPSRVAQQLARDLKLMTVELDTLEGGHWSGNGYEDVMRQNLTVLRTHIP